MAYNYHGSRPISPVGNLLNSEFHQEHGASAVSTNFQNSAIHHQTRPHSASASNYQSRSPVRQRSDNNPQSIAMHSTTVGERKQYLSSSRSINTSTSSRSSHRPSALDNPLFAPPPPPPSNADVMEALKLSRNKTITATLPQFDKITHSGHMQARISLKSLMIKKWRQIFWITYGNSEILMFRSKIDFQEWATNPYLSHIERDQIVKLKIEFKTAKQTSGVRCYRAFALQGKNYGKSGLMHTFKLEQWMHYGPVILGAFASSSQNEIAAFHTICKEIIRRQKCGLRHYLSSNKGDDEIDNTSHRSLNSTKSAPNTRSPGFY